MSLDSKPNSFDSYFENELNILARYKVQTEGAKTVSIEFPYNSQNTFSLAWHVCNCGVLVWVSIAILKHYNQKQLTEERVYLACIL